MNEDSDTLEGVERAHIMWGLEKTNWIMGRGCGQETDHGDH